MPTALTLLGFGFGVTAILFAVLFAPIVQQTLKKRWQEEDSFVDVLTRAHGKTFDRLGRQASKSAEEIADELYKIKKTLILFSAIVIGAVILIAALRFLSRLLF